MHWKKDSSYYRHMRQDILAVTPPTAQRVLSVGCGAGVTEGVLVERGASVVGLELDPAAAAEARTRGLEVLEGDAEEVSRQLEGRRFDCLLYADVLEHLREPEALLAAHVRHLDKGGTIIVSVPNFRHWSVFWRLFVIGEAPRRNAGIFDRTHVQLTTRRRVQWWVREAGATVTRVSYPITSRKVRLLSRVTLGLLNEFLSKQVIVVARRGEGAGSVGR